MTCDVATPAEAVEDAVADAGSAEATEADAELADVGLAPIGTDAARRPQRRASLAHRLYNGEAGLDVVGHSRLIYRITAVVLLVCLASMIFRGFNFGIEFVGGSSFRVPGTSAELTQVRAAAENAGAQVSRA